MKQILYHQKQVGALLNEFGERGIDAGGKAHEDDACHTSKLQGRSSANALPRPHLLIPHSYFLIPN